MAQTPASPLTYAPLKNLTEQIPCRRFAAALAGDRARLGVDVDRYSFIVSDLHRLLIAGLPAHCERFWTLPIDPSLKAHQRTAIRRGPLRGNFAADVCAASEMDIWYC